MSEHNGSHPDHPDQRDGGGGGDEAEEDQAEGEAVLGGDVQAIEVVVTGTRAAEVVDDIAADLMAGVVGDVFSVEMTSPWGDRWVWAQVEPEVAQEAYKVLGQPVTFRRVGT